MPWQGSKFVQDGRSPLDRLYGYQETMAKMQAMKQQQDLMRERQKILAESLTPAQAGSMDVQFSQQQPAAMSFPQIFQQQLTGGASANILGAQGPEQVKLTQTEAKPAQFDAESAVARLYGASDLEGAQSIVNDQYKDAMGERAGGKGASGFYGTDYTTSDRPGFMHPVQYDRNGGAIVNREVYVPERLTWRNQGGQDVAYNSRGEAVRSADVTPTAYQSFQMSPSGQASVAAATAEAETTAREKAQKKVETEDKAAKASDAITELTSLSASLGVLPPSAAGMKWESAKAFFTGGDPKIEKALGDIDRISGRMLEYANKLPGSATESDRILFMASAGVLQDPNATTQRKIAAAQSAISSYQRMIEADRRAKAGGQSAPAPMPSLPNPAQHNGRIVRDTATGVRWQSNGKTWVRVK